MAMWFFVLGLPLVAWGLFSLVTATGAARALVAFPRSRAAGRILCAVGWFWTAYECDTLGIDVFDKFLKVFPGELWILAAVLTVLTGDAEMPFVLDTVRRCGGKTIHEPPDPMHRLE